MIESQERTKMRVALFRSGKHHDEIDRIFAEMDAPKVAPEPQKVIVSTDEAEEINEAAKEKLAQADEIYNKKVMEINETLTQTQVEKNLQALYRRTFEDVLRNTPERAVLAKLAVAIEHIAKAYGENNFSFLMKVDRISGKWKVSFQHYPLPSESPEQINPEGEQKFNEIMAQGGEK